jgi:hypothetical protein
VIDFFTPPRDESRFTEFELRQLDAVTKELDAD